MDEPDTPVDFTVETAMDIILLIVDYDVRRRHELRRFLLRAGILVAVASDALECLSEMVALSPDVLVVAADLPSGGYDKIMTKLSEGLPVARQPLVLVTGDGSRDGNAGNGIPPGNWYPEPVDKQAMLDRIALAMSLQMLHATEHFQQSAKYRVGRDVLRERGR